MKFCWNMERLLIAMLFSYCLTPSKGATHECHGHHHCTSVQCPSLTSVCVHGECRCSQYGVGLTCHNYHHAVNTYDPSCVEAGMNCTEGLSPSCHGGYCSCTHDTYRCNVVNDCIHGEQDFHLGECVDVGGVHGFWFCSAEHHCKCIFYSHTDSSLVG
ncbi:uncharacterized protein LOC144625908 [Crassostrea virginica]